MENVLDHANAENPSAATLAAVAVDADDMAVIVFSRVASGTPKGIIHTHRTLLRHISHLHEVTDLTEVDCVISLQPIHLAVSYGRLFGALLGGAELVLYDLRRAWTGRTG